MYLNSGWRVEIIRSFQVPVEEDSRLHRSRKSAEATDGSRELVIRLASRIPGARWKFCWLLPEHGTPFDTCFVSLRFPLVWSGRLGSLFGRVHCFPPHNSSHSPPAQPNASAGCFVAGKKGAQAIDDDVSSFFWGFALEFFHLMSYC